MAERKHRDRGYSQKKKQPWSERHKTHDVKVFACPVCFPSSSTAKEQENKNE